MVWYATIALCLLSGFIVRITYLLEKELVENHGELNEDSTSNSMLMTFGFIFQQSTCWKASEYVERTIGIICLAGYSGKPWLTSSRVLTITMLLFSVLMFQFYSSFLVGSLLTDAPKNIKTVKQLLNSPFKFGIDVVPYIIDLLHITKDESIVQLYNKIMKSPEKVLMPLQTGLKLMKQGRYFKIIKSASECFLIKKKWNESLKDVCF